MMHPYLLLALLMSLALTDPGAGQVPPGTRVDRDLVFVTRGTQALVLDLYRPERADGPLPVVVWIYGGAWLTRGRTQQASAAAWLTTRGYAVAAIDYRLSSEAIFPAQLQDCRAAVRWLRANAAKYGLDAGRMGAWGASSGGHLATLLGLTGNRAGFGEATSAPAGSSRVLAVVDFYGPTDFLQMDAHALPGAPFRHDAPDSPESRLVGGPIGQHRDRVAAANPITYVTADAPPFLIMHGEQDPLVPWHQSELLFEALQQAGVDVAFYKLAGAGHGGPAFDSTPTRGAVQAFFDRHLKPRD
jgi:acetyl esterase/lipase